MKRLLKKLAVTMIVSLVGYSSLNAEEIAPLKLALENGMIQQVSLFPKKLSYGRSMEVHVDKNCDLLEVETDMSKGNWIYNFQ